MGIFNECANNVTEFLEKVKKFENECADRTRNTKPNWGMFYRGQKDNKFDVKPSIFRESLLEKEHEFYSTCLKNLPYEFNYLSTDFDKLAKMQHYGIPTRILDFTYDPKISLYFACESGDKTDGRVIMYNTSFTNQMDYGVRALTFLATYTYEIDDNFFDGLRKYLKLPMIKSNDELRKLLSNHYFVDPEITNERLHRQKGLFVIFGQDKLELEHKSIFTLDEKNGRGSEYEGYIGYINISGQSKKDILTELEEDHNVSKLRLLPELDLEMSRIKNEIQSTIQEKLTQNIDPNLIR